MFSDIFTNTQQLVVSYGIWGVFAASLLEEIIVPIPSALIMLGAGFFFLDKSPLSWAALGILIMKVALPAAIGTTLGSLLIYGIAYYSGKPALERWGKYFAISWRDIENAQAFFKKGWSDELLLILVRTIPVIPGVAVSAFCGLVRLPLGEYMLFSILGTFCRAMLMGFVGWQVGSFYLNTASGFERIEQVVLLGMMVIVAGFMGYRMWKKHKKV